MRPSHLFCADNRTRLELFIGRTRSRRVTKRWLFGLAGSKGPSGWKRSDLIGLDVIGEVPSRYVRAFVKRFAVRYRLAGYRLLLAPGVVP